MKQLVAMAALAVVASAATAADHPGLAAAKQNACLACHGVTNKIVGPAFRDVGAKYKGDASAEAKLIAKVKAGGSGAWGPIPMPAQAHVKDDQIKSIVAWILDGAKN